MDQPQQIAVPVAGGDLAVLRWPADAPGAPDLAPGPGALEFEAAAQGVPEVAMPDSVIIRTMPAYSGY